MGPRSEVIDLNENASLTSQSTTREVPRFSSVLDARNVPPFPKGPRSCASVPQRGSGNGPTNTGGGNGSIMSGQPAAWLAAPTNVAASFIARIINRYRWIAVLGIVIIIFAGARMVWEDAHNFFPLYVPAIPSFLGGAH